MAKSIITANEVREARKEGRAEIAVPPGAVITPQARDDAREFGIRFAGEASRPVASSYVAAPVSAPVVPPNPAVRERGSVPGRITLYAGKAFEEAATGAAPMPGAGDMRNTSRAIDCKLGVYMLFLTEEDIRQRAIERGGELTLSVAERLTPSAMEYIRAQRIRVVEGASAQAAAPVPAEQGKTAESSAKTESIGQGLTHLDATSMVAKTHPRIEARGKLDSLMAAAVLVQTQFDPKGKLPGMLKDCLAEVKAWIFQSLAAEVSGSILPPQSMGGMNMDVLRAVSRNPRQYLHTDHLMPDAALGANIALLNWLRALARETELAVAKAALCRTDIQESLNRLSSAVYVLMLLTHLAESGAGIPKLQ
ncbi:MAG: hypothetical protein FWH34_04565 [Desulfovibrionaceae bacterium]|nr:hypothetical protein [Desulfovibrionaceae bacterium]